MGPANAVWIISICCRVAVFQNMSEPSPDALARVRPSGEKASQMGMAPGCPRSWANSCMLSRSQSLMWLAKPLPAAKSLASGEKASECTSGRIDQRARSLCAVTSHNRTMLSLPIDAMLRPSAEKTRSLSVFS